jgi:ubiquinone/menaquinone biosynthesis C-methylase UbiE
MISAKLIDIIKIQIILIHAVKTIFALQSFNYMDKNKIAVGIFDKLASLYQEKYMDLDLYDNSLDEFCALIPKSSNILDVACGPGNITRYLLKRNPDFQITGIDLSPNMVRLAQQNNPTANFEVMDCRNIRIQKQFNGLVFGFGLPYLSKDEASDFIASTATIVLPNGILYMSTMEDAYADSGIKSASSGDQIYMHYYMEEDLRDMLRANGFKVLNTIRQDFPTQDGSKVTDLIIIAKNSGVL